LLRFGSGCLSPSPERSFVVRAVKRRHVAGTSFAVCDAVELSLCSKNVIVRTNLAEAASRDAEIQKRADSEPAKSR